MSRKYIIYLTTNLENGMIYKGVHFNKRINPYEFDGYLGSGVGILEAIKEFGKENFKRETLFVFDTKEEAVAKEKEEIPIEFVNDPNTYNRTIGGGDWPVLSGSDNGMYGNHHTEKSCCQMSESRKGEKNHRFGTHPSEETRKKIGVAQLGEKNHNFGKHPTEETRKKISIAGMLPSFIVAKRVLDTKKEPKVWGWKANLARKWGLDKSTACDFIKKYIPEAENYIFNEQRLLDVRNEPKIWGWKENLAKKWGVSSAAVVAFIKKYLPHLSLEPSVIREQRRLDVKKEPKVKGWRKQLALKWHISDSTARHYIFKYASDLL